MRSDYEMGSIDGGQLERVGSEIPSEEFYRTPCNSTTASSRCSGRISPAQALPGIRNNSVGSSPRSDLHLIRRRRQESVAERGHTFRNHSRFSNNTTDSSFVLATPQEIGLPSLSSEELNTWMWYPDQSPAASLPSDRADLGTSSPTARHGSLALDVARDPSALFLPIGDDEDAFREDEESEAYGVPSLYTLTASPRFRLNPKPSSNRSPF
ncbi:predicted protein [Phaeodactylum tricornutum CCAP 1055/1]|jgi:hypothetical protein|uniref:Uncharacterized protein n=1 Tax=Phaeodactylum tricornutum (strain CCAP 1055/1) TaxID=556484 RepID=B7GDM8_PHATC|nr:predicted protein [Phaeodactylum tricornutum CCAP 1055/1]EEC43289.1 predicted protein [Phaeodactylum tricornutum CCAP 1055/1]|eukprot:XP_002185157.1 predicted protein [Phaeodactylum tricornutum CCAP 1055/1]